MSEGSTGSPSRRESTLIQFGGGVVQMGLVTIQGILLVPLYLAKLSGDLYGMWLALTSMVALLGFFELGLANLVCQQVAVCLSRKDHRKLGVMVGVVLPYTAGVMTLVGVGGALLVPWLPAWVGVQGQLANALSIALYVAVVDLVLMLAHGITGSMLLGLQRPGMHVAGLLIGTAVSIAAIVLLLHLDWGILALACGSLLRPLIALPTNLVALYRALRKELNGSKVRFERKPFLEFFFKAAYLGPARAAEVLAPQVDNIILITLLRPIDVTIMNLTRKAGDLVVQVVGRLAASSLSGLAHLYSSRQNDRYGATVLRLLRISLSAAAVGLTGVFILNGVFVTLWTRAELFGGQALTTILCLYAFLKISRVTFSNVLFAAGYVRVTAAASVAETVVQLTIGYLLCRWWGTPGLAAGACLAAAAGIAVQRRGLASTIRLTGAETRQALVDLGCLGGVLLTGCLAYHFWTPVNWTQLTVFGLGLGSLGGGILLARQREALHLAGVRLPRFGARLVVRPTSPK